MLIPAEKMVEKRPAAEPVVIFEDLTYNINHLLLSPAD
jgi:hypothetical protein